MLLIVSSCKAGNYREMTVTNSKVLGAACAKCKTAMKFIADASNEKMGGWL